MGLIQSTVGVDSGLNWENNLNISLMAIDDHDHSPGKGVPINSASITIAQDLPLNNFNLTTARSVRFSPQSTPLSGPNDLAAIYVSGQNLYYNDTLGRQIQITNNGTVQATSSGLAGGTAQAQFVSNVLVVTQAPGTPGNISYGSAILQNTSGANTLTLQPPSLSGGSEIITLPIPPVSGTDFLTITSAGAMLPGPSTSGGITGSNIAGSTIAGSNLIPGTITSTQLGSGAAAANLSGTQVVAAAIPSSVTSATLVTNTPLNYTCGAGNLVFITILCDSGPVEGVLQVGGPTYSTAVTWNGGAENAFMVAGTSLSLVLLPGQSLSVLATSTGAGSVQSVVLGNY